MAKYRKLSRTSAQRKALIRSQVTALIQHGKIVTTEAKAKEIRKVAEACILPLAAAMHRTPDRQTISNGERSISREKRRG